MNTMGAQALLEYFWPEWHVIRSLGHGSFGDVFECEKTDGMPGGTFSPEALSAGFAAPEADTASKHSAVKVILIPRSSDQISELRADGVSQEDSPAFFEQIAKDCIREIKTMESLKSAPNVVYIEDFKIARKPDQFGWVILIRMELLMSLTDYQETHPMQERDVLKLGIDLCRALVTCQKKNIIHRDIKPGNIMVNDDGDFKLADFGIARELDKGEINMSKKGTDTYMAPEMHTLGAYDARVDQYALGIVLYQLLNNNRIPFLDPYKPVVTPDEKHAAVMRRIAGEAFPPPVHASEATAPMIMRACACRPENRFLNAEEMLNALIAAYNALPDTADGPVLRFSSDMPRPGSYTGSSGSGSPLPYFTPPPGTGDNSRTLFTGGSGANGYRDRTPSHSSGGFSSGTGTPVPRYTPPAQTQEEPANKRSGAMIAALSALIGVLLIALGIYCRNAFFKGKEPETTQAPTETAAESETVYDAPVISRAATETGTVLQKSNASAERSFGADQTLDGDPLTCWCVSTSSPGGAGASILFVLQKETEVKGIRIVNGNMYEPTDRLFQKNGQVCEFTLTFSNGSSRTLTATQNNSGEAFYEKFTFDEPVVTGSILLTVVSAYPGYKFTTNVCLGEFDVF